MKILRKDFVTITNSKGKKVRYFWNIETQKNKVFMCSKGPNQSVNGPR